MNSVASSTGSNCSAVLPAATRGDAPLPDRDAGRAPRRGRRSEARARPVRTFRRTTEGSPSSRPSRSHGNRPSRRASTSSSGRPTVGRRSFRATPDCRRRSCGASARSTGSPTGSHPASRRRSGSSERDVRDAYGALYGEPIETAFTEDLSPRERLRWTWTTLTKRLENLPPFWMAYALTLTETVGASILALPIAVAELGPLPGVVILVLLGLVNVLTVSLMAESVARSGAMRYRNAFLGRLVEGYLGSRGALGLSVLLVATSLIELPLYYVGLGDDPGGRDVAASGRLGRRPLRRDAVRRAPRLPRRNRRRRARRRGVQSRPPPRAGRHRLRARRRVQPPARGGSVHRREAVRRLRSRASSSASHSTRTSATRRRSCAEASSSTATRAAVRCSRGCAAATATSIVIFCIFVLAINGAVGADALTGVTGTVIGPLAEVGGTGIAILGSVYVVLTLGMGSIFESLSLSQLVRERIPTLAAPCRRAPATPRPPRVSRPPEPAPGRAHLPRTGGGRRPLRARRRTRRARRARGARRVGPPRPVAARREGRSHARAGGDRRRRAAARVAVTTTLRTAYEGELDGASLDLTEALSLSDEEAALTAWLVRSGPATRCGCRGPGQFRARRR